MKPAANAIELWSEEVEKYKFDCPALDRRQTDGLVGISISESQILADKELLARVENKEVGYVSAFWLRVKHCHTYTVTLPAALFLGIYVIKNFGMSTMLANYLQWVSHTHNRKNIDLSFICTQVFPMGFPSDEQWRKLWDMQKVDVEYLKPGGELYGHPDNILDYEQFAETIR